MLLDASKAFDRVNYSRLFRKLLRRNISPAVLRVLLKLYTIQFLQVKWGSKCSGKFSVQNGVNTGMEKLWQILVSVCKIICMLANKQKSGIESFQNTLLSISSLFQAGMNMWNHY